MLLVWTLWNKETLPRQYQTDPTAKGKPSLGKYTIMFVRVRVKCKLSHLHLDEDTESSEGLGDCRSCTFVLLGEQRGHQDEGDGTNTEAINKTTAHQAGECEAGEAGREEEAHAEAEHTEGSETETGYEDEARVKTGEDQRSDEITQSDCSLNAKF